MMCVPMFVPNPSLQGRFDRSNLYPKMIIISLIIIIVSDMLTFLNSHYLAIGCTYFCHSGLSRIFLKIPDCAGRILYESSTRRAGMTKTFSQYRPDIIIL